MPLSAVSSFDPSRFLLNAPGPQSGYRLDTGVSAFSVSNDVAGQLSVMTAEGDRVTLSADLGIHAQGTTYQAALQTSTGSAVVSAQSLSVSLEQEFGITVQGDLNAQERQDLASLFHSVTKLFRNYVRGQDETASATAEHLAQRFSGLSSLSNLDLNVEVQRTVTVMAAQSVEASGREAASVPGLPNAAATTSQDVNTPGEAPETGAVIPPPSVGTEAPRPSTIAAGHLGAASDEPASASSLVQQILDTLERSRVEHEKVWKILPEFFAALRDRVARGDDRDGHQTETDSGSVNRDPRRVAGLAAYQAEPLSPAALSLHS